LRKNKWLIDVLLVVIILALGYLIVRQLTSPKGDGEVTTETEQQVPVEEETSDPTEVEVEQAESKITAPDFSLQSLAGVDVTLSEFRGKPVIVNFWATWCPPCKAEMPLFDDFANRYPDSLVVLAVNSGEKADEVIRFAESFSQQLIFLLDPENSLGIAYGVRGLPTTFFIDREGYLQALHIGELTEEFIANYLEEIGIER